MIEKTRREGAVRERVTVRGKKTRESSEKEEEEGRE